MSKYDKGWTKNEARVQREIEQRERKEQLQKQKAEIEKQKQDKVSKYNDSIINEAHRKIAMKIADDFAETGKIKFYTPSHLEVLRSADCKKIIEDPKGGFLSNGNYISILEILNKELNPYGYIAYEGEDYVSNGNYYKQYIAIRKK